MNAYERNRRRDRDAEQAVWLMGHLLVAMAGVVGLVLDADRALIPDNVWEAAEQAKAQLDEHCL